MFRLKLASIIALIAGPFVLFIYYSEMTEKKKIDREGVETIAIPTTKFEKRGRKGSRSYKLEIQYPVEGAGTQTAKVDVSHELYDNIESKPIIKIKYLKTDPKKLIILGEPLSSTSMMVIGFAVLLFGIGGTWWFIIKK